LGSLLRLSRSTPAAALGAIPRGCGQIHGGPSSRPCACASRPAAAARCLLEASQWTSSCEPRSLEHRIAISSSRPSPG
jgi:hypothetical protein